MKSSLIWSTVVVVQVLVGLAISATTAGSEKINSTEVPLTQNSSSNVNIDQEYTSNDSEFAVRFELMPMRREEVISHYCTSVDLFQFLSDPVMYIRDGVMTSIAPSVSRVVVYGFSTLCDDMFFKGYHVGSNDSFRNDTKVHGRTLVHSSFDQCGNPHRCLAGNAQTLFVWSVGEESKDFGIPAVKAGLQVDVRPETETTSNATGVRKRSIETTKWNLKNVLTQDRIRYLFVVVDYRSKNLDTISTEVDLGLTIWFFRNQPQLRVGFSSLQLPGNVEALPQRSRKHVVDIPCMYSVPSVAKASIAFRFGLQPLAVRAHTHSRGRAVFVAYLSGKLTKHPIQMANVSSRLSGTGTNDQQTPLKDPSQVLSSGGNAKETLPKESMWTLLAAVNPLSPQVFRPVTKAAESVNIRDGDYLLIRCVFDTSGDEKPVPVRHNVTTVEDDDMMEMCNAHLRYATAGELPPTSLSNGSFMHCLPNNYAWLGNALNSDVTMTGEMQKYLDEFSKTESKKRVDTDTYSFMLVNDYALLNSPQTSVQPAMDAENADSTAEPLRCDPGSLAVTEQPATSEEILLSNSAAATLRLLQSDTYIDETKSYAVTFDMAQAWSVTMDARDDIYVAFSTSTRQRSFDWFDQQNAYTGILNGPGLLPAILRLNLTKGLPPKKSQSVAQQQTKPVGPPIPKHGEVDLSLLAEELDKLPDGTVGYVNITGSFAAGSAYFAYRVRWFADENRPCTVWVADLGVHQLLQYETRTTSQSLSPVGALPREHGPGTAGETSKLCKPIDLLYKPDQQHTYIIDGCHSRIAVMQATGEFEKLVQIQNWQAMSIAEGPDETICLGDYNSFTIRCYTDPHPSVESPDPVWKLERTITPRLNNGDLPDVVSSYRVKTLAYATNRQVFYVAAEQRFNNSVSLLVLRASDGLLLGTFSPNAPATTLDFALSRDELQLVVVDASRKIISRLRVNALGRSLPSFKMDCSPPAQSVRSASSRSRTIQNPAESNNAVVVIVVTLVCVCLLVGLLVYCLKRPKAYLILNRKRFTVTWRAVVADVCYCFTSEYKNKNKYSIVAHDRSGSDIDSHHNVESHLDNNASSSSSSSSSEPGCSYTCEDGNSERLVEASNATVGFAFSSRKRSNDRMALLDSDEEC